ncbi:hypothetical protein BDY17DRAFT_300692 [Neohortaea acidophila]|uniref:Uncharacterized protein n=1 Tax=Neohortaea acidophila TaxID=245834 RepID=A0A6A6PPB0_9PEZI|nr:uncharacterized protein BDY17DRAFT_300692 [Neohortaea acidophila]KAF2481097.1 hypothetical protein BDY17DRAFT_300692 [Neohortaea acidophila]
MALGTLNGKVVVNDAVVVCVRTTWTVVVAVFVTATVGVRAVSVFVGAVVVLVVHTSVVSVLGEGWG